MNDSLTQEFIDNLVDGELGSNILHLISIINSLPGKQTFIDLGVETGKSSKVLLHRALEKDNKVFGVDPINSVTIDGIMNHPNYTFLKEDSVFVGNAWTGPKPTIIFIDTVHIKPQTIRELYYWWDLLEIGGWIICHDTEWKGYIHKKNHSCAGKKPGNSGLGYDFYAGRKWETPEYALFDFFNIKTLNNIENDNIKIIHHPESLGMTFIQKKREYDYKSTISIDTWNQIEEDRKSVLKCFAPGNIVHYASGGLANRIKPFLSCWYIAEKTNRTLISCWPSTPRCQALFTDLFKYPKIEYITEHELETLNDVILYTENGYALNESQIYGNCSLLKLNNIYGNISLSEAHKSLNDNKKNVIIYSNTVIPNVDNNIYKNYMKRLVPVSSIQNDINTFLQKYNIDNSWIGVHVRATDFDYNGTTILQYINAMKAVHKLDNKYFVCSDSQEAEQIVQNIFPNNVVFRPKTSYVKKNNVNLIWNNNTLSDIKSCQDALVDLYLLARTGMVIHNKISTFSDIVSLLQ